MSLGILENEIVTAVQLAFCICIAVSIPEKGVFYEKEKYFGRLGNYKARSQKRLGVVFVFIAADNLYFDF